MYGRLQSGAGQKYCSHLRFFRTRCGELRCGAVLRRTAPHCAANGVNEPSVRILYDSLRKNFEAAKRVDIVEKLNLLGQRCSRDVEVS